jgi:hypothetical protein
VATVLLLFTLSGPVKASTYLVCKSLPCELFGAVITACLIHLELSMDICSSKFTIVNAANDLFGLLANLTEN